MSSNKISKPFSVVVAGVGGQGAITLAQLILDAAWRCGYQVIQSEVHGMSQRGGSVTAQIIFDKNKVTSPVVLEGNGDLLIGMEPLETLRNIKFMRNDAYLVSSSVPIKNMSTYPNKEEIITELKSYGRLNLLDTDNACKKLGNKNAGNIVLLGVATNYLPIKNEIWLKVINKRFERKGEKVIEQNINALEYGRNFAQTVL